MDVIDLLSINLLDLVSFSLLLIYSSFDAKIVIVFFRVKSDLCVLGLLFFLFYQLNQIIEEVLLSYK